TLRLGKAPRRPPEQRSSDSDASRRALPRRARPRAGPALLEIDHLGVSYGAHRAVDDVTLKVAHGAVVGLIGPNGAGKTSLVDALTGFVSYTGQVFFDGELLQGAPHVRCRRGLARTWQSLELFDDLTVRENLLVAAETASRGQLVLDLVHPARPGRLS